MNSVIRDSAMTEAKAGERPWYVTDVAMLVYLGLATVILHVVTGNRYGFQRDELATLDDAKHLAWGYVAYPPVTPFFGRISLILFGTSLAGFRFFAAIAQALAVVLSGLMARELGGGRGAQLVAAAAALPFCLAAGTMMQYVSFDYLCWVLTAYFVLKLLKSEDPRWWLAIGAGVGFGMLSKYGMVFFAAAIAGSLLLTDSRRYLKSKWLWYGVGVALLIFSPNLLWQVHNNFISLDMLRHIHARDVRQGRAAGFLPDQLWLTMLAAPLWIAGLWFYLFSREGRRYRMLGWMYVIPLMIFIVAKGRGYYLAAAYPMLYAGGSVWGERWLARLKSWQANTIRAAAWIALTLDAALVIAFFMPVAPLGSRWWQISNEQNGDLREEIGWPELAQEVARIRDTLSPEERAHLAILGTNYGEAGAINLYGPQYGLPQAISGVNSFWVRGYGETPPKTVIVIGLDRDHMDEIFQGCRLAGHTWNHYNVKNEETVDHPDIYVCGPPKKGWETFWRHFRYFG